jgi:hypothetical protein
VPLESDEFRCPPGARLRVYRTRNAGASWQPLYQGLPQEQAWGATVLRDGLCTDTRDPAGIYFGTRNGSLFGSRDEGRTWKEIAGALPPIVCVRAAVVGEGREVARRPASARASARPRRPRAAA